MLDMFVSLLLGYRRDRRQIALLILNEFKRINLLLFLCIHQKTEDFKRNRS